jgi:AraC-like DNA-binding protein
VKIAEVMDEVRRASGNVLDMLELKQKLDGMGISLENIYQELEMSSAVADSHRDISTRQERLQPHSHSFFELIYCCNCDDVQYLLGSQRYRLRQGDVLLIPPGVRHCPLFPEVMRRPYERIVVWINAEVLRKLCQRWPEIRNHWGESRLLRTAGSEWEKTIAETFQRGCRESEQRLAGWEAALYGNTTMLITLLNRALDMEQQQPDAEHRDLLDKLLAYVEGHLQEKISVRSAARHLLVSESTITHLCRRRLGTSFYRHVTGQRLAAAKRYMRRGIPLGQVWEMAGFCDYSAFYRAFKQEFGFSPREFRDLQDSSTNLP